MMAEVSKYSTYTQQMTAYASIDKNSASRNEKVQIDTDNIFVTDTFENDTEIREKLNADTIGKAFEQLKKEVDKYYGESN